MQGLLPKKNDGGRVIALAGNPNVGKSTIFNALTGMHQHTGNWPGKTVALASGTYSFRGQRYILTDLPGTYSLLSRSPEEEVAAAFVRSGQADCVVVICDGTCLERTLLLALQIMELTDRVTILRDGRNISTFEKKDYDTARIIHDMIGRDLTNMYPARDVKIGEEVLRVEHLTVAHPHIANKNLIEDVSFCVHAGEVLGMAGLVGAGRSEVCMAIFGMLPIKSGEIYLHGKKIDIKTSEDAIRHGIGMVSEDRKIYGLNFVWDIRTNIAVSNLKALRSGPLVSRRKMNARVKTYFDELRIKAPTMGTKVVTLSGGNQQKVVIARSLNTEPKIIILDEPTKGIDVGSKNDIYNIVNSMVADGVAVIMISSELPELMGMSDRFVVMAEGRVVGELSREEGTDSRIMEMCVHTFKKIQ